MNNLIIATSCINHTRDGGANKNCDHYKDNGNGCCEFVVEHMLCNDCSNDNAIIESVKREFNL